jgi:predicted TIM-barrel fold metal-dependent hydrolase
MERFIVVSGDGHVGCPLETIRPYVDPAYRDSVADLPADAETRLEFSMFIRSGFFPPEVLEAVDDRGCLQAEKYMDVAQSADAIATEMDAEGVAAAIVRDATEYVAPFFDPLSRPYPMYLQAAGARAFNRWMADLIGESNGRLYGNLVTGPGHDLEATLAELRWAPEHGFVSATAPVQIINAGVPPTCDAYWEPFWATCAEVGLVVEMHVGWGRPQGFMYDTWQAFKAKGGLDDASLYRSDEFAGNQGQIFRSVQKDFKFAQELGPQQRLWQLMLNGVFDRHPSLRLTMTELRADWVPATLAHLEERFDRERLKLKLRPSEYFARHVGITPSAPRPTEVQMRHEIGIDRFMFGTDMPHAEGTWPNTRQWIQQTFHDVPEDELRKILGENAIQWFGLDRERLAEIAAEVGPTPDEIYADSALDEKVLDSFHHRSGYRKPVQPLDTADMDARLTDDLNLVGR